MHLYERPDYGLPFNEDEKKKTASGFEYTSIGRKAGALTTELQPQPVASQVSLYCSAFVQIYSFNAQLK